LSVRTMNSGKALRQAVEISKDPVLMTRLSNAIYHGGLSHRSTTSRLTSLIRNGLQTTSFTLSAASSVSPVRPQNRLRPPPEPKFRFRFGFPPKARFRFQF